jgi:hypothetical protein
MMLLGKVTSSFNSLLSLPQSLPTYRGSPPDPPFSPYVEQSGFKALKLNEKRRQNWHL